MVRAAVFVLLVVGGVAIADPLRALTFLPKLPGSIAVVIWDAQTGAPVVEATVIAQPIDAPWDRSDVRVTDHAGRATLEVASGPTRLTIMYGERTVESFAFSDQAARQTVHVPHVDMSAPPDPCPRDPNAFTTPKDSASLLRAVVSHAPQIADGKLLTKPVVLEGRPGLDDARGSVVLNHSAIERNADRTGKDQTYLAIDHIQLGRDCARVESRISIAQPRAHRRGLLCCCSSTDVYWRRSDDSWVFLKNLGASCG